MHFPFLNRPPESVHLWRQSNTLAMARNFSEEGMNILEPKVDRRGTGNGITGSQFPSYEYILALSYKAFGEKYFLHRIFSFLLYAWGAWGISLLAFRIFKNNVAAQIAAIGYLFSPELFYHGINALPDILALPCSIWAFYYYLRWLDTSKTKYWIPSLCLLILAGLTKLQFLIIAVPAIVYSLQNWKRFSLNKKIAPLFIYAILAIFIPLAWYAYARYLIQKSGLTDFGLEVRYVKSLAESFDILQGNFLSDLPEQLLGYAMFFAFAIGVFFFFRNKAWKSEWALPLISWGVLLLFYHIAELKQMRYHGYYMMPHLPFLILGAAYGAKVLAKKIPVLVLLIVIVQPVLTGFRIIPNRWMNPEKGLPQELYQEESRLRLQHAVPDKSIVVAGADESGCIYFYFLHKKGFGFNSNKWLLIPNETEKNEISRLEEYKNRGAEYLYIYDVKPEDSVAISKINTSLIMKEGKFNVYILN